MPLNLPQYDYIEAIIEDNSRKKTMAYSSSNCTDKNNFMPLRKGLTAIAMRRTGLVALKAPEISAQAQNTAAPKEISAAKCPSISLLSL